MKSINQLLALISFVVVTVLSYSVTRDLRPHSTPLHLVLAVFAGLCAALYFFIAALVGSENNHQWVRIYESYGTVQRITRQHKIVLAWAMVFLLLAGLCFIGSLILWSKHTLIPVSIYRNPSGQTHDVQTKHFAVPIWWWLPLMPGVLFLFVAVAIEERWRTYRWILTDRALIERQDVPAYFPLIRANTDPTELNQIIDLDDDSSLFGSVLGWGDLKVKAWSDLTGVGVTPNTETSLVLRRIPHYGSFMSDLRRLSPKLNRRPEDFRDTTDDSLQRQPSKRFVPHSQTPKKRGST